MKLTELNARFVCHSPTGISKVETLDEAQGVWFDDPLGRGSASLVWFRNRGVPDDASPGPLRAVVAGGTGLADLTLQPSIDQTCGGRFPGEWHGFITNGVVT